MNRKLPTRTDQRFSPSLLKTRIAEPEQAGRSVLLLAENSFETVIDVSKMEFHRTELLQLAGFEVLADIGVRQELSFEIRAGFSGVLGLPGFHCVALAQFVGVFASEPLANQRQENGLRVPHPQRDLQVALHVLWIDNQALCQFGQECQHVIQQRAGIRENNAFNRAVTDIPLVPESDVFKGGDRIAA